MGPLWEAEYKGTSTAERINKAIDVVMTAVGVGLGAYEIGMLVETIVNPKILSLEGQGIATTSMETKALHAASGVNPWQGDIFSVVLKENTVMYRVWGGGTKQVGEWLTPMKPTNSIAARSELALPPQNAASYYSEVIVPADTRIQIGIAAPAFGQQGGGLQVQLMNKISPGNFGPGIPLK